MTGLADMSGAVPAEQMTDEVRAAFERLLDENALLRASIAELRARLGEAEAVADTDPLTGLADRVRFLRELSRVVGQADRHGTPSAMLSIDLKGLDAINEAHGRTAGDAALIQVARLLQGLIRTTDVIGRTGGGAFGLVLDHLDQESAIDTAERLARCIAAQPLDLGHARVALDATIGVATILPGDDAEEVIARAERARDRLKEL